MYGPRRLDVSEDYHLRRNWSFENSHSCSHCNKIIIDIFHDGYDDISDDYGNNFVRHTEPVYSLGEARAAAGECEFFSWFTTLHGVSDLDAENRVVWRYGTMRDRTQVIVFGVNDLAGNSLLEGLSAQYGEVLMMMAPDDDPAARWIKVRPINTRPGSKTCLSRFRSWMEECLETHVFCPKPTRSFMPSRLIKIGPNFEVEGLRLIDTHGEVKPFAALSYCWGGDIILKTTTENIKSLKQNIRFDNLPGTIRDAIWATNELGIYYLWVDALCIIQDELADTMKEISQMANIYGEATVTLLASSADGARSGIFNYRDSAPDHNLVRLYPTVRFPFKCPFGSDGEVTLMPLPIEDHAEPLDKRAWTLQERLLAPRVLEFGTNQTRWNCSYSKDFGGYTDGWTDRECHDGRSSGFRPIYGAPWAIGNVKKPWNISWRDDDDFDLNNWHNLVLTYTSREMTFPSDRLPAIAGIAARYDSAVDDEYLAGMWKSVLLHEILWNVNVEQRHPRPSPAHAPSWSWASIQGQIGFPNLWESEQSSSEIQILSAIVHPLSEDAPFAGVQSGELVVSGQIRDAIWRPMPDFRWEWETEHSLDRLRLSTKTSRELDDLLVATVEHDAVEEDLLDQSTGCINVVLLKVSQFRNLGPKGLMLRQLNDATFSRLGVFSFEFRNPFMGYNQDDILPAPSGVDEERWAAKLTKQLGWFDGIEPQIITIV